MRERKSIGTREKSEEEVIETQVDFSSDFMPRQTTANHHADQSDAIQFSFERIVVILLTKACQFL
jgi:hypothetical protein